MKPVFSKSIAAFAGIFVVLTGAAHAQNLSDEARKAILEYPLTMDRANHLIPAMEAMSKYVVTLPDYAERVRKSSQMTTAERLAQLEKDPKAMDILKKNTLTARDYIVGVPALRMALLAASGMTGPTIVASPANIAFAKTNLSVLKPKMDAVDGLAAPQRK
jgi:hypothetical protein